MSDRVQEMRAVLRMVDRGDASQVTWGLSTVKGDFDHVEYRLVL